MLEKSYSELLQMDTMQDRYEYLRMHGLVSDPTFGSKRYLNQRFYQSPEWKETRRDVIIRDNSCDLAIPEYQIYKSAIVHHINPITIDDLLDRNWDKLLNPENLITVSYSTHQAIHYGSNNLLPNTLIERTPGDTCPWKEMSSSLQNRRSYGE